MNRSKRLAIIIPVWGSYCDVLLNNTFKSFLLKDNITYFDKDIDVIRILTSEIDSKKIDESEIVKNLRRYIHVEIIESYIDINISKYKTASMLHQKGLNKNPLYKYAMMHHPDDCIMNGTIKFIQENIKKYKLIMTMSLRVNSKEFIDSVENFNHNYDYEIMLKNVLNNLHDIPRRLIKNSVYFNNDWPSHIYWADKSNFIGRCLHMHPLALNLENLADNINISGTVDDHYFLSAVTENNFSKIKVIRDKLYIISLTEKENDSYKKQSFNYFKFLRFAAIHAGKIHLHLFNNKIHFKSKNVLPFLDNINEELIFFKKYQKTIFIFKILSIYYSIKIRFLKYFKYKNYINKIIKTNEKH